MCTELLALTVSQILVKDRFPDPLRPQSWFFNNFLWDSKGFSGAGERVDILRGARVGIDMMVPQEGPPRGWSGAGVGVDLLRGAGDSVT